MATVKWFASLNRSDLLKVMFASVPVQLRPANIASLSEDGIREVVRKASLNGRFGAQVLAATNQRVADKKAGK